MISPELYDYRNVEMVCRGKSHHRETLRRRYTLQTFGKQVVNHHHQTAHRAVGLERNIGAPVGLGMDTGDEALGGSSVLV